MNSTLLRSCRSGLLSIGLLCALPGPASAHEFWMLPKPFAVAPKGTTRLTLNVGEYFSGDVIAFSTQYVAALHHYARDVDTDLLPKVSTTPTVGEFLIRLEKPGTHLFSYDSQPNSITLGGEKFNAYLHDEGLDTIVKQREAAGNLLKPARERYRRFVKTLVQAGDVSDAAFGIRTRQRLEIVPLIDPLAAVAGERLGFALYFEEKPLANALLKAWRVDGDQTLMIRARTDAAGRAAFDLPYAGTWMLSVVHMISATGTTAYDYDSLWGNLTFSLKAAPRTQ